MSSGVQKVWGLFGGAGFIGQHLALSILRDNPGDQVYLLDIVTPAPSQWKLPLQPYVESGRLLVAECDVRVENEVLSFEAPFDVIVNLAAVHREPGHHDEEYFETNLSGARNICALAQKCGCQEIIFTSSISVYGIHDRPVDESAKPQPYSPYGQSKLEAESIHIDWARQNQTRLSIIRPGVVFGPGESGNVTRLLREMLNRQRAIRLKPDQPKAGIYIRELIELIHWLRRQNVEPGAHQLVNGVSNQLLTFNAFGRAFESTGMAEKPALNISVPLIRVIRGVISPFTGIVSPQSRIHPERIAKIYRPNDIRPANLESMGFPFSWPLDRALTDWTEQGL